VLLQGSTHSYIHGWTSFNRTKLCPSRCYLTFFHIPERSTSKTTGWFTKRAEIDPNLPHANKVLLQVAHAFLYTLMDFFQSQTVPKTCYLLLFHIPERSLVKRLAGSPKGLKLIPTCHANKVLLQGSTRILIYMMDFFQSQTVPKPLLSYLLPYSRSIALVKRLAGSQKAEIDPNLPHANKVLLQGSTHSYIH
jgi:hypothetical protein